MPTDKEQLITAIERHKEELIATNCRRLQQLRDSHYEIIDYECHLEREENFLNALLDGLRAETPESFLNFVDHLSEIRSEEGYSLEEFQEAFNIVEDSLWETLVARYPCDESLVKMLSLVSRIFRMSKDNLARVYLNEAFSAERELEHLRKKFRVYRRVAHQGHA
jgi:transcriptional regulator with XRE-family HTH domain